VSCDFLVLDPAGVDGEIDAIANAGSEVRTQCVLCGRALWMLPVHNVLIAGGVKPVCKAPCSIAMAQELARLGVEHEDCDATEEAEARVNNRENN
jgi:hypothetical protein